MGDKSPKSKQRNDRQKDAAKARDTNAARNKQNSHNSNLRTSGKGKG